MRSRFKDESDLVFSNGNGGPLDGHNMVNRHFRPTLKKAGLPKVRFHDLRHTFATLLLQQGVPVTVVSKMLGHASAKMTLDTYSHVLPDSLDEASTRWRLRSSAPPLRWRTRRERCSDRGGLTFR